MTVVREDRVITIGEERGARGRDGVTGGLIMLEQTNSSGSAPVLAPVEAGSAYGIGNVYAYTHGYATTADTITFEITGFNDTDARLGKIAGSTENFDPKSLSIGQTVIIQMVPSGPRAGAFDVLHPGVSPASADETLDAFTPGGGLATKSVTPAGLAEAIEALGVMLHRNRFLRPTKAEPYVAWRASHNRIMLVTPVEGGNRMDYAFHEFINQVPASGPVLADCFRYNGCCGAWIDGLWEEPANFSGEPDGGGNLDSMNPPVFEPVCQLGPVGGAAGDFDFVGPGHWHLTDGTSAITLNGGGLNYRLDENFPIGTVLRGASFGIDQSFTALLKDDTTVVGTYSLAHIAVSGGVQISGRLAVTGTDIAMTVFYGAMLSGRGDRIKPAGLVAIPCDQEDGDDYGISGGVATIDANLGEAASYQLYPDGRDAHIYEAVLVGGAPIRVDEALGGVYSWAENGANRDAWAQARTEGYAKIYIPGVNKSSAWTVDGKTFDFNVIYRVRKGALA